MKEKDLQKMICEYLDIKKAMRKLWYMRVNSGMLPVSSPKYKNRMIRLAPKGTSDLIIFLDGGKCLFVELKSSKGKQTEYQELFEKEISQLGYEYHLINCFEDFEKLIK
jgi:hypothetical protein